MSWGHPVAGINIWSPELRRDDKAVPSNRSTGFWLVSGRPNVNAPPRYLTSAISRQAGRLFHPTHPRSSRERARASLVAVLPSRGLSISSDEALRRTRSYIHRGNRRPLHETASRAMTSGGDARQRNRDVHAPLPYSPSLFLSRFLFLGKGEEIRRNFRPRSYVLKYRRKQSAAIWMKLEIWRLFATCISGRKEKSEQSDKFPRGIVAIPRANERDIGERCCRHASDSRPSVADNQRPLFPPEISYCWDR